MECTGNVQSTQMTIRQNSQRTRHPKKTKSIQTRNRRGIITFKVCVCCGADAGYRSTGGKEVGQKAISSVQRTFVRGGCTPFLWGRFLSEHNLMHRDVIAQFQLIRKWKFGALNCSGGSDPCPWIRCHGIYSKQVISMRGRARWGRFGGGLLEMIFHLITGSNLIFPVPAWRGVGARKVFTWWIDFNIISCSIHWTPKIMTHARLTNLT